MAGATGGAGVLGEYDIRQAARRGERVLYVAVGTVVSPSARDAAQQFAIELRPGSAPSSGVAGTDHSRAVQRGLYRRSPRWVAPEPRRGQAPTRFGRIAFAGAGAVGAATAHQAAIADMADELVLIDVVPGLAAAVGLDIEHASGITGSPTRAHGSNLIADVAGADVIVVTAGRPRSPGMTRADLATVNGRVVRDIGTAIGEHAPGAVVIVVTNPVDEMTHELWSASGLPDDRVIGMAGTLDSSRFRHALATAAAVAPRDVEAIAIGSHGEEMVPVVSSARIKGRPARDVLRPEVIARCVRQAIDGGAAVVALRRTGSASIAPAHAVIELLDAMRGATAGPVPAGVRLHGEYGIDGVFLGVPVRLTPTGVGEISVMPLDAAELAALQAAAQAVGSRLNPYNTENFGKST